MDNGMNLKNHNGLWVDEDTGACVGYLFDFTGKGVFSPDGKVEISPEDANKHNELLAQGEIKGLDENCAIGQRGTFYYNSTKGVHTWTGVEVAPRVNCRVVGKSITFTRNGKTYRGRLQKDADCFNFRRTK
jgi:hypothetical protein